MLQRKKELIVNKNDGNLQDFVAAVQPENDMACGVFFDLAQAMKEAEAEEVFLGL